MWEIEGKTYHAVVRPTISCTDDTAILAITLMDYNKVDSMPLLCLRVLPGLLVHWLLHKPSVTNGGIIHVEKRQ